MCEIIEPEASMTYTMVRALEPAVPAKRTTVGPALGAKLKELEARWIASGFTLSREQLLA